MSFFPDAFFFLQLVMNLGFIELTYPDIFLWVGSTANGEKFTAGAKKDPQI